MARKNINQNGQRAYTDLSDGYNHAFVTGPNGVGKTDLGTLGGKRSYAEAINESGQVVGWSETTDGNNHAFITDTEGVMKDLGTLNRTNSKAFDINDFGEVVGYTALRSEETYYSEIRPFITGPNGENMVDLGSLIFYDFGSFISDMYINNPGQVIINTMAHCDRCVGSLLYDDGAVINLSSLPILKEAGFHIIKVEGINDEGQIFGRDPFSFVIFGFDRRFLLTPISPVPEPSVFAMLLIGLGILGFLRKNLRLQPLG